MTNEAMAAVAAKFRASLESRADEIEAAEKARAAGGSALPLVTSLHKLAGSAGFYAETGIAELAANLEGRLDPARNGGFVTRPVAPDIERLVTLLRTRARES